MDIPELKQILVYIKTTPQKVVLISALVVLTIIFFKSSAERLGQNFTDRMYPGSIDKAEGESKTNPTETTNDLSQAIEIRSPDTGRQLVFTARKGSFNWYSVKTTEKADLSPSVIEAQLFERLYNQSAIGEIYPADGVSRAKVSNECLPLKDDDVAGGEIISGCKVTEFGHLGTIGSDNYYYALYSFPRISEEEQRSFIIFRGDWQSKNVKPILTKIRAADVAHGASFSSPKIEKIGGEVLIAFPFSQGGNGGGFDNYIYRWTKDGFAELDSQIWEAELKTKIPPTLKFWGSPMIDLPTLSFESVLWKEEDSHACPTGGSVKVNLRLDAKVLHISSVKFDKSAACQKDAA